MSPDDLVRAWRSQGTGTKVTIDADLLLREVRRNDLGFRATILWRDIREIVVSFLLAALFVYLAVKGYGWPWWVLAASITWVGGFLTADRFRQRARAGPPGASLADSVRSSLEDINHQIWLLENVFWWYLLPPGVGLLVSFAWDAWEMRKAPWAGMTALFVTVGVCIAVFFGVYWLNQLVAWKELRPRRQELEALLAALLNAEREGP